MSKHRKFVAVQITRSLYETENSIDSALTQVAKFVAELPAARQEANFAACVGQDAIAQAIVAMTALNNAREAMIKAHEALAEVRDHFNIGPTAFGSVPNKPAYPALASATVVPLASVA